MDILIVVEHRDGQVASINFELAKAVEGKGEACFLVASKEAAPLLEQLKGYGVKKAIQVEHENLAHYDPNSLTSVVQKVVQEKGFSLVLAGHTSFGWDLMPKLAMALEGSISTNVISFAKDGDSWMVERPSFGEKLVSKERLKKSPYLLTVAPGAFPEAEKGEGDLEIESVTLDVAAPAWEFQGVESGSTGEDVNLEDAEIIVSGGRGLKEKEKFEEVIRPLAETLGAAIGASRPVVDDGWLPRAHQVGSSGKVVKPKLYMAIGISGQTQHIAGMKNSQCIVAINKDKEAPIFDYAHYGVVGDLFEIVPKLTEKIKELKG